MTETEKSPPPANWLWVFLKGAAMGAANVIPGVSGGTVAFITGIYERLIDAIKACDLRAVKLLLNRDFRGFARKTDFWFLAFLGLGVVASIVSLAKILRYLFDHHAIFVWAFFFGLILASILFVGAKVGKWGVGPIVAGLIGAGVAVWIALLEPVSQNDGFFYLALCGVIAMASMIIPGLSGSFVLLLLGNYQLVMIDSVAQLSEFDFNSLRILGPVVVGAVVGLVALSHLLSWIFRRFHDVAVALLTGFVAGSLMIIWPWKDAIEESFGSGENQTTKVVGYDWRLPDWNGETFLAIGVIVIGFALVWLMERVSGHPGPGGEKSAPV